MKEKVMIMVMATSAVLIGLNIARSEQVQTANAVVPEVQTEKNIQKEVEIYFTTIFARLEEAASQNPTIDTFRTVMKPVVEKTPGIYGATFIDTNFVIKQVYYPSHFLARGFDLKKVKELDYFWEQMRKNPTPQVSEPGHGNIMQPRLIAMRHPVIKDGKLISIISIMLRTEYFLAAVGLDKCKAYRITCRGTKAEEEGNLGTNDVQSFTISLPCNEWKIEYRK